MRKTGLLLSLLLALAGCATLGEQTRELLRSPPDGPRQSEITDVPFVKQSRGYCGPASLAMVMNWAGEKISLDELGPEVYTDDKKGSLQMDLISASRRHGLLAIPLEGMPSVIKELAARHPVIVLQNLGISWFPQWHYSVLLGYDLDHQEFTLHSGDTAYKKIKMDLFERDWKSADYWALVVLPPSELAATGNELDHLKAAVGLEQAGQTGAAETAYQTILKRWPESLAALIGLGNTSYKKQNYAEAVDFLKKAARLHPDSEVARHNLAIAEQAMKK